MPTRRTRDSEQVKCHGRVVCVYHGTGGEAVAPCGLYPFQRHLSGAPEPMDPARHISLPPMQGFIECAQAAGRICPDDGRARYALKHALAHAYSEWWRLCELMGRVDGASSEEGL